MEEKVIGLVYRYGPNDYQINLMDFDDKDQEVLMSLMERYDGGCSCERGDKTLTLEAANVEYWERELSIRARNRIRKELAHELYQLGMVETDAFYDEQSDEQVTEEQIADDLKSYKRTAYTLETILQFCDDPEGYDYRKFFNASMKIVHYMENFMENC